MKLLLVCNPGGHYSTMMGLKKFWSEYEREWVTYRKHDTLSLLDNEVVHWVVMQEARMFGRALFNFFRAILILKKSKPDLVISTGAGLAVPLIYASKLFGIKTMYIESITRARNLSFSGRLVYHFVDDFYVQWPGHEQIYSKAKFRGIVGG